MNETAKTIVETLNETDRKPIQQIETIVNLIGEEEALEYLQKAQALHAEGSMMTEKGDRQRTLGGVFFYLVRGGMTWSQRRHVFPYFNPDGDKQTRLSSSPYRWVWRVADFKRFKRYHRGVSQVEIKVVGKPLKVIEKTQVTVVTMRSGDPPSLPKGLPAPPATPTVFLVLIASKQWKKVKPFVTDPDNKLIVRGWPVYDKKLGTITVLAQSTTATLLERQKQAEQNGGEPGPVEGDEVEVDDSIPTIVDDAEIPVGQEG